MDAKFTYDATVTEVVVLEKIAKKKNITVPALLNIFLAKGVTVTLKNIETPLFDSER